MSIIFNGGGFSPLYTAEVSSSATYVYIPFNIGEMNYSVFHVVANFASNNESSGGYLRYQTQSASGSDIAMAYCTTANNTNSNRASNSTTTGGFINHWQAGASGGSTAYTGERIQIHMIISQDLYNGQPLTTPTIYGKCLHRSTTNLAYFTHFNAKVLTNNRIGRIKLWLSTSSTSNVYTNGIAFHKVKTWSVFDGLT